MACAVDVDVGATLNAISQSDETSVEDSEARGILASDTVDFRFRTL